MENMKLPIALVAAMAVQLAGAVWWVSQQAATISSLEENVEQFASRMAVENTVNLKRDVQESKSDIVELWEDSDEVWEEMAAMLASFSSINDLKQRIALLDQAHYTMVKTNFFNGVRMPSIAIWDSRTNDLNIIKEFSYEDFENKLS